MLTEDVTENFERMKEAFRMFDKVTSQLMDILRNLHLKYIVPLFIMCNFFAIIYFYSGQQWVYYLSRTVRYDDKTWTEIKR